TSQSLLTHALHLPPRSAHLLSSMILPPPRSTLFPYTTLFRSSLSLTCRNPSSPASGSGASANQPSMTGSSVRWIAARRDTPVVSAAMCRSAPSGSAEPSASSRATAAEDDRRASYAGILATATRHGWKDHLS